MFVINSLGPGGAERVASLLLNHLCNDHSIILVSKQNPEDFFYNLHSSIRIITLSTGRLLYSLEISKIIHREAPDQIISFMTETNILTLIASKIHFLQFGWSPRLIISERSDPRKQKVPPAVNLLRFLLYRFSDRLVIQTKGLKRWAELHTTHEKVEIIPNPISLEELEKTSIPNFQNTFGKYILSIGRFTKEKGHSTLLDAFELIQHKHSNVSLILIGEGPEKDKLQLMARDKGIKSIHFLGKKDNVIDFLKNAYLFILPSYYEGFPNVLLEALALGIPSISFNCQSGPSELLTGDLKRFLVDEQDPISLAEKINWALTLKELNSDFIIESKNVLSKYSLKRIAPFWIH